MNRIKNKNGLKYEEGVEVRSEEEGKRGMYQKQEEKEVEMFPAGRCSCSFNEAAVVSLEWIMNLDNKQQQQQLQQNRK